MSSKDPLWSVVKVLPTDYATYGGQVPEAEKTGDCSSGCRWCAYLEQSGDWLVCTKPGGPRFGLLTWEHQAGLCFEWACDRCLESGDKCKCPPEEDLTEQPSRCWFCGKGRREVGKLIVAGSPPGLGPCCICNECIGLCYDLVGGETGPTFSHTLRPEQHAALVAWATEDENRSTLDWTLGNGEPLVEGTRPETDACLAALAVAKELHNRFRPADPPTTWGWATDPKPEHWFIGDDGEGFPSREAALADARAAEDVGPSDELWLVTGARLRPSTAVASCDAIDVGQWMEIFVKDNFGGDYAPGWPEISPVAEAVFDELVGAWADRWLKPLPWRATGKPERVDQPRPHVMDGPDGPVCRCGKPSAHESGWCGQCHGLPVGGSTAVPPYGAEGCICTETVVGKSECPVHGSPPALLPAPLTSVDGHHSIDVKQKGFPIPCRPEECLRCRGGALERCDMCGGTGQTCATHARSWSLCADERDKP